MKLIPLTQGYFAQVSNTDYRVLKRYKWRVQKRKKTKTLYAQRYFRDPVTGKPTTVSMHRQIMGFPKGLEVDHRDGDGLNNKRRNLRKATHRQNMANRRNTGNQLKGITRERNGKWRAQIYGIDGRKKYLGTRDTKVEAHELYVVAAKEINGEFARV